MERRKNAKRPKLPMRWFTVIGLCEDQRHAHEIRCTTPQEAEDLVKREHDTETGRNLRVAGVAPGRVFMVA